MSARHPQCTCPPRAAFHRPACAWFDGSYDPASHGSEGASYDSMPPDSGADLDTDYPGRWRDGDAATRDTYPPTIGD